MESDSREKGTELPHTVIRVVELAPTGMASFPQNQPRKKKKPTYESCGDLPG
jgi:hypothetical protein